MKSLLDKLVEDKTLLIASLKAQLYSSINIASIFTPQ